MSKIQKHSVEELVDKAEADTELEMDGGVAGTVLGMRDGEVRLTAEAGGPPSVGSRIPIACTCDKKLQNRKLRWGLPFI
jgi:hypothetical protein